jgi:hypothetical protein
VTDRRRHVTQSSNQRAKFTSEGGLAVLMTNRTGAASVKGSVVTASHDYDNAFSLQTEEFEAAGIVYDSGVADGSECWVVASGIADVLVKDGIAASRGSWTKCADVDGRCEPTTPPTGIGALSTSDHFREIGHCLESKAAGTNVLAKVLLHFN